MMEYLVLTCFHVGCQNVSQTQHKYSFPQTCTSYVMSVSQSISILGHQSQKSKHHPRLLILMDIWSIILVPDTVGTEQVFIEWITFIHFYFHFPRFSHSSAVRSSPSLGWMNTTPTTIVIFHVFLHWLTYSLVYSIFKKINIFP